MELPNIGRAMPSMEVEDIEPTLKACASMEGALRVKAVLKEPALNALEHTRQRALSYMELVLFDHAHGPPAEPSTVAVPAGCVRAGDRGGRTDLWERRSQRNVQRWPYKTCNAPATSMARVDSGAFTEVAEAHLSTKWRRVLASAAVKSRDGLVVALGRLVPKTGTGSTPSSTPSTSPCSRRGSDAER